MKITAFVGSARKKSTYRAAEQFLKILHSIGNLEYEIVSLSEYHLMICRGCKLCMDKGEEFCPLEDDRDILLEKMRSSDGIVFASPNYSFQVSGYMKVFLDRLGFFFHRPYFFGKTFTNIVSQGVYGAKSILKYLNFIGKGMGFNTVKGCSFTALEPIKVRDQKKIDLVIKKQSDRFLKQLKKPQFPKPGLFELMIFRITRTRMKYMLDDLYRDHNYFMEKGWFDSDFYYPVKLNPIMRGFGNLFDRMERYRLMQKKKKEGNTI
jgi:multimeric flavodoxin WrbA